MNDEPQNEDLIRYDILTQEALRGVIKRVLEEVMNCGLPGEHHFFITFDTNHPGVRLSKRMKERYPEDMTIVIQHTYWDLEVNEGSFKIDLSFDDIRERLKIPYDSVKGFFDPWVKFGLQFEAVRNDDVETIPEHLPVKSSPRELSVVEPEEKPAKAAPKKKTRAKKKTSKASKEIAEDATSSDDQNSEGAEVVSLDSFRKKK